MRARMLGVVVLVAASLSASTAVAKCPSTNADDAPIVSQAAPPADLASRLAVLRRPQTPDDLATIEAFKHQYLHVLYAKSLRLLRSDPDGRSWYLYVGRTPVTHFARSCLRRMPRDLRRSMLQQERYSRAAAKKARYGVFEFNAGFSGGFFGGDLRTLTKNLEAMSVRNEDGDASVSAMVPDGVAWVDLTFGGDVRRVVGVTDNFWQVDLAQESMVLPPRRTVWKAADGTVVATFRSR